MFSIKTAFKLIKVAVVSFVASTVLAVLAFRFVPVPGTPLMIIRAAQHIGRGESPAFSHKWVPLERMSKYLPVAVMASEDQKFLRHHGFDFGEIENAAADKIRGKRSRGASTISQQTAKNVFLWPSSTWVRKGFEAYFTVLIELLWPKERIMEVYLNCIETAPDVYGAEAVARENFGCSAKELTRSDCALIAATLPAPLRFSSKHPSGYMLKRQRQIERQMRFIPLLGSDRAK